MGKLPAFSVICHKELRLDVEEHEPLKKAAKEFEKAWKDALAQDPLSPERERQLSNPIELMARSYIEEGWSDSGTQVEPGKSFWIHSKRDHRTSIYRYPEDEDQ